MKKEKVFTCSCHAVEAYPGPVLEGANAALHALPLLVLYAGEAPGVWGGVVVIVVNITLSNQKDNY